MKRIRGVVATWRRALQRQRWAYLTSVTSTMSKQHGLHSNTDVGEVERLIEWYTYHGSTLNEAVAAAEKQTEGVVAAAVARIESTLRMAALNSNEVVAAAAKIIEDAIASSQASIDGGPCPAGTPSIIHRLSTRLSMGSTVLTNVEKRKREQEKVPTPHKDHLEQQATKKRRKWNIPSKSSAGRMHALCSLHTSPSHQ